MPLSLDEARRIAAEVVNSNHPSLRVVGATAEGGSSYTEIILTNARCHAEPCRMSIGVPRDVSEADFRADISEHIRRYDPDRESSHTWGSQSCGDSAEAAR